MKLLTLGPEPPPYSGTTVSYALLLKELAHPDSAVSLVSLDLQASKTASPISKLLHTLRLVLATWRRLFSADLAMLNASNTRAIVMGFALDVVCLLHRKPLVIRVFGGALMEHLELAPRWRRWMAERLLSRRLILLQTHYSIDRVRKNYPDAWLEWFPNSRPAARRSVSDRPQLEPGEDGPVRFYFAGNICNDKGVDLLLELAAQYVGPAIEIHFFGELLDGYTGEQIVAASSEHCVVRYHGVVPSEQLFQKLPGFDALLFPTRFVGEGYPGVILEAFAHGLPVVASDWFAVSELVDEQCGVLLPVHESQAWMAAIIALAQDRERLARLADGALARAADFDSAYWHRERLPAILRGSLEGRSEP